MAFGLTMGIVFPFYANFFVTWKEGMLGYFIAGAIGAGLTVGLVNHFLVKFILIDRLKEIADFADRLNSGNLSATLDFSSDDAVGDIVNRLNDSIGSLRDTIISFRDYSQDLFMLLEGNLGSKANGLLGAVSTLSSTEERIAQSSAEEKRLSTKGLETITGIIAQLETTQVLMTKLRKINTKLVEKSSEIDTSVRAIEEIASKINLISMNATVESVRAGEHGRSFGEVAKEIQALSTSSTNTAHAIRDLIAEISSQISDTKQSIDSLESSLQNDMSMIGASEGLFEQINDLISTNDESINNSLNSVENINTANQRLSMIASNMKHITEAYHLE